MPLTCRSPMFYLKAKYEYRTANSAHKCLLISLKVSLRVLFILVLFSFSFNFALIYLAFDNFDQLFF